MSQVTKAYNQMMAKLAILKPVDLPADCTDEDIEYSKEHIVEFAKIVDGYFLALGHDLKDAAHLGSEIDIKYFSDVSLNSLEMETLHFYDSAVENLEYWNSPSMQAATAYDASRGEL